jgi:hypothetical protein
MTAASCTSGCWVPADADALDEADAPVLAGCVPLA